MKKFRSVKNPVKKIKRQAMDWENIYADHISNKGFVYRIYQELLKLNCKKPTTQFFNGNRLEQTLHQK